MRDNIGYPDQLMDEKHLDDLFNEVKLFSPNRFVIIVYNYFINNIFCFDNQCNNNKISIYSFERQ